MKLKYFGDSYDIVKQGLLRWLNLIGDWEVHPMFTEAVSTDDSNRFERFLGAKILTNDVLHKDTNRKEYLKYARNCSNNVFLDPDTGIRINNLRGKKSPAYLFISEFIEIAESRPNLLTLSFDQSLARGKEREQLKKKIFELERNKLHGFAYESHACFILVGKNMDLVNKASAVVRKESRLPIKRFLCFCAA